MRVRAELCELTMDGTKIQSVQVLVLWLQRRVNNGVDQFK